MFKLNLGCGKNHKQGYINIDKYIENKPDIVCDLEKPLPFKNNCIDKVVAFHTMEHINNLWELMKEIWRICKPKAKCFFVTPHKWCYEALGNPHHVRVFDEWTWWYFNKQMYNSPETAGYAFMGLDFNYNIDYIALIPYPQFLNDKELDWKKEHMLGIIREVHASLEVDK